MLHETFLLYEWRVKVITPNNGGWNICAKHGTRIAVSLYTETSQEVLRRKHTKHLDQFGLSCIWQASWRQKLCAFFLSPTPFCVKHNEVPMIFSRIEF